MNRHAGLSPFRGYDEIGSEKQIHQTLNHLLIIYRASKCELNDHVPSSLLERAGCDGE